MNRWLELATSLLSSDALRQLGAGPPFKALPVEFLRGPDLIGKTEMVDVAKLACFPLAVPFEIECMAYAVSIGHGQGADEIRTTADRTHFDAIHRQVRLGVEQLRNRAQHLHARAAWSGLDASGRLSHGKCGQIDAERRRCVRSGEEGLEVGSHHMLKGNQSGSISFCA